jgi:hypothetical protein
MGKVLKVAADTGEARPVQAMDKVARLGAGWEMDTEIEFNSAAFKHGVSEADIRCALRTNVYGGPIDDDPNKCAVIGFDLMGLPLEVMYNPVDENTI